MEESKGITYNKKEKICHLKKEIGDGTGKEQSDSFSVSFTCLKEKVIKGTIFKIFHNYVGWFPECSRSGTIARGSNED